MCAVTHDCCIITLRCPDRTAIVTYILMERVCYNAAEIYSDKSNICLVTFCFPCIDLMWEFGCRRKRSHKLLQSTTRIEPKPFSTDATCVHYEVDRCYRCS